MGRVRKYKKVKSVDPFSNAKRSVAETKYDQPPSIWEGESRKAAKRANYAFDNEKAFERMLQHAAKRQLKIEEDNGRQATGKDGAKKIKAVEAKRDDETMKQFKNRVREETRKTLKDELTKLTSTSKKKKQFLKDKKMKKKGIELADVGDDEVEEGFSSRSDGVLRYSDTGGTDEFRTTETVTGIIEQGDRPPEFHEVGALKVKAKDGMTKIAKPAPGKHNKGKKVEASRGWGDDAEEQDEEGSKKSKKKKKKRSITDIVDSSAGDDSAMGGTFFGGGAVRTTVGGAKASKAEMESLRAKVISSYREMRNKKRKF